MRLLRDVRPDLPKGFIQVVERALSSDPAGRFSTAGQMEQALEATLGVGARGEAQAPARDAKTSPGVPGRRGSRALVLILIAAAAVAAGLFIFSSIGWLGAYQVQAIFYRETPEGKSEPLQSGARVTPGDLLSMEFTGSRKLYVYVLNQDDEGESYLLFPLSGSNLTNPLPADQKLRLPGAVKGLQKGWVVTSAGRREHFLVLATPDRPEEFEADLAQLPPADPGRPVHLPGEVVHHFRGVGGVGTMAAPSSTAATSNRLFQEAHRLAGKSEAVRGAWLRQFDLENPRP
jgi:hypothetical protein